MSEIFENLTPEQKKDIQELGNKLKEARENLGYTLDYVSDIIRISVYNIQQLEKGNYSPLKNMLFLKGSLKNYCNFIRLNSSEFLAKIDEIFPHKPRQFNTISAAKKDTNPNNNFLFNLLLSATILIAISLGIYFLVFFNFEKEQEIDAKNILDGSDKIKTVVKNEELILRLTALQDGWARIAITNDKVFEIFIKKEVAYQWKVNEDFKVILAHKDLATVTLNDKIHRNPNTADDSLLILDLTFFQ